MFDRLVQRVKLHIQDQKYSEKVIYFGLDHQTW